MIILFLELLISLITEAIIGSLSNMVSVLPCRNAVWDHLAGARAELQSAIDLIKENKK